jgi:hypothetical protein
MNNILTLLLVCFVLNVYGQNNQRRSYTALKTDGQHIVIDGKLDEEEWANALWQNNFTQFRPSEGEPPLQQTEFAILYDENNVYVGIKAFDTDPDSIVQRLSRRDEPDGDLIGIQFDTFNDQRTAFAFITTAAGVKFDFVISNDGEREDPTWDPIWWVKTSLDEKGWYAEMRIPFSQLRFENKTNGGWGLQVGRIIFRNQEMSVWQPADRKQNAWVSQFGRLHGIENIAPKKNLDILPYLVGRTERFEKEPENPFRAKGKSNNINAGIDAKIGVTNNLTLDLTMNPDFGQVEADPSQVNLTTYETFFREQRPFFIEGKNILSFPLMFGDGDLSDEGLFYTRRIGRRPHFYPQAGSGEFLDMPDFVRIIGAAKLTGKTKNGWSVGFLESVTAREYADLRNNGSERSVEVEPLTNFTIGRLQKDFNEGNTMIGGMFTAVNRNLRSEDLEFLHKSAYTGGLDFVHKWNNKNWEFNTSLYFSNITGTTDAIIRTQRSWSHLFQRPDASHLTLDSTRTSLSGHGGKIVFGKLGGNLKFINAVAWKSPGLELNDAGYMRQADNIFQVFWIGYRIFKPFSIFRDFNGNFNQWTEWNFAGKLLNPGANINLHTNLKNYWDLHWGINVNGRTIRISELRGGPALKTPGTWNTWWGFGSNNQKMFTIGGQGTIMRSFENHYREMDNIRLNLGYRPMKTLRISLNPGFSNYRTSLQYVSSISDNGVSRYIFGSLNQKTISASLRINFNLTPELSLQYWGQPFISTGNYSDFKYITNSMADNYYDRYHKYTTSEITHISNDEIYRINEAGGKTYSFENPDFSVKEFLSNMVIRWEYQPGSTLFLVWSQNRKAYHNDGSFEFSRDIGRLFGNHPHDVFLVKLSYRIGR